MYISIYYVYVLFNPAAARARAVTCYDMLCTELALAGNSGTMSCDPREQGEQPGYSTSAHCLSDSRHFKTDAKQRFKAGYSLAAAVAKSPSSEKPIKCVDG